MAPAYKLTYFNIAALAEPARYLFAYGNIEFEDVRITHEEWPQLKPNAPYGQLPLLEHNGKVIGQSVAIAKYIAKLVGLTGKDAWEDLQIDSIVGTYVDFSNKTRTYHLEKDETKKEALKKELVEETIPYYMERFEAQVKKNNGYFVGGRLTWADVYISLLLGLFDSFLKLDVFSKYPAVKKLHETVISNENYKKWQKTVPPSS